MEKNIYEVKFFTDDKRTKRKVIYVVATSLGEVERKINSLNYKKSTLKESRGIESTKLVGTTTNNTLLL